MEAVMLVRYAEIHLKGLNRPYFERSLMKRISLALRPLRVKVVREQGRVFVFGIPQEEMDAAADKLTRVFGIHSVSPALAVEKEWEPMVEAAKALVARRIDGLSQASFKVIARRADKRFAMRSQDICRMMGGLLLEAFPVLRVDVHQPDFYVGVEVRQEQAFVFAEEKLGAGGMPVGTNGHAMLLISGGIDSPVAGHMIAKRGVQISAVHFYSYPYTSERAREKVVELTRILASYAGEVKLYLVPFTEIQLTIYEKCPKSETTILMRRLMMQISEKIALSCGAQALVTGESIGQVASQTLPAIFVTDEAADMPVFRPLIGMDKEEITVTARKIGTFETSILPYEDCCTIFTPKHPALRPQLDKIKDSENLLDVEILIQNALDKTELEMIEI
ncbi:putative tRNA sulfurtransferase [bioreactor metagenome]|uniref:Putative tRNA sulfurtransferase n=1 Tax=bioreactor metagenome TaxID=1076179 RepID=A0A645B1F0_9ZZZZ